MRARDYAPVPSDTGITPRSNQIGVPGPRSRLAFDFSGRETDAGFPGRQHAECDDTLRRYRIRQPERTGWTLPWRRCDAAGSVAGRHRSRARPVDI